MAQISTVEQKGWLLTLLLQISSYSKTFVACWHSSNSYLPQKHILDNVSPYWTNKEFGSHSSKQPACILVLHCKTTGGNKAKTTHTWIQRAPHITHEHIHSLYAQTPSPTFLCMSRRMKETPPSHVLLCFLTMGKGLTVNCSARPPWSDAWL